MKIARVTATPLNVPLHVKLCGADRKTSLACCFVEVETDNGIFGHGLTSITEEDVIAQIVNGVAGPAIVGDDPLNARARLGQALLDADAARPDRLRRARARRDRHRAVGHQGQGAEGQPVWRLLGGARDRAPVYATFGFGFFDREQLAAAAKLWVSQGFKRLKMTVGNEALRHRDKRPVMDVIREDAARVRAVREAVGPDIELYVDGNCNLDLFHATKLVEMIKPLGIAFFEEPLTQNDALQMRELRRATGMALACGQNEGLAFRFRDLLLHEAVDFVQPNVAITGGFTQCLRIAGLGFVIQRVAGERRRLGLPQHAPAGRRRERHAGRAPLSRGRALQADLSRPADAGGRVFDDAGQAGARLRAEPRCDPRDREAAAVEGGRGRASAFGNARGAGRLRTAAACPTCGGS